MFQLDVVQAAFGDCLVLRYGDGHGQRALLIDGGPTATYAAHLAPLLHRLAQTGLRIDAVVLSHIDNDHVGGLLELFHDLERERAAGGSSLPPIDGLWHNAFGLSTGGDDLAPRVRSALQDVADRRSSPTAGDDVGDAAGTVIVPPGAQHHAVAGTLRGVAEGDALRTAAQTLSIPINAAFGGDHILVDDSGVVGLGSVAVEVIGPSRAILARLRTRWLGWLRLHMRLGVAAVPPDGSLPNLSSIVLLVRSGPRSILLTGDGRGDQILTGLGERGLLDADGTFHVDVLKVPHHGSARNTTAAFYRRLTADRYVISADGRYSNPDLSCLRQIVEAAHEQQRRIELVITNETDASRELRAHWPPANWGYTISLLSAGEDAITVPIEPLT